MARRKARGGTARTGDVLPPPPAIPTPPETDEDRAGKARTMQLLRQIRENLREQHLARAVVLAQMAYRRQGPLVEFFEELGFKYGKLADEGPQKPALRIIDGGSGL
jgi:hypothetical protein